MSWESRYSPYLECFYYCIKHILWWYNGGFWFLMTHPRTWRACRPISTSPSSLTLEKKTEHYRRDIFLYMTLYDGRGNILTVPPLDPTGPTSPCSPRSPWNQNIRRCSSIHTGLQAVVNKWITVTHCFSIISNQTCHTWITSVSLEKRQNRLSFLLMDTRDATFDQPSFSTRQFCSKH